VILLQGMRERLGDYQLLECRAVRQVDISALADGGPHYRSAHARPSAWTPVNMKGNFLAHLAAKLPSIISPNP
jgi:hypothetical protein